MKNRVTRLLVAGLLTVALAASGRTCLAQDPLDENPEFKRMYLELSKEDRERFDKYFSSLSPEERRSLMAHAVATKRAMIAVEHVYARCYPAADTQQSLVIAPFPTGVQPLTEEEVRQLQALKLCGKLQIEGYGLMGSGPKIRVVLIMQKQVPSRVEFALPTEGTLILAQTDTGWLLLPDQYEASQKTVRIQPSTSSNENRTSVDFDIGNGRGGSDAFRWPD
ncbi:MAG: hypothetical protein EHM18_01105 [Acidobacteria bacterium]|nr:MAG: hypothetical protein EHM18_01105 [Acidobacteriota bacterium]